MGTVALVLLLIWLVSTAIMTFGPGGRLASQHETGAMRRQDGARPTSPPASEQSSPE